MGKRAAVEYLSPDNATVGLPVRWNDWPCTVLETLTGGHATADQVRVMREAIGTEGGSAYWFSREMLAVTRMPLQVCRECGLRRTVNGDGSGTCGDSYCQEARSYRGQLERLPKKSRERPAVAARLEELEQIVGQEAERSRAAMIQRIEAGLQGEKEWERRCRGEDEAANQPAGREP